MASLPESVRQAWEHRNGPVILATADTESMPNAIYATCVALHDECTLVIADNYFDKTKRNILAGSRGSVLFITDTNDAFQIKGTIAYHTDGPIFDHMKTWNPTKHPGHAAAVLTVEEVYSGAEKLL